VAERLHYASLFAGLASTEKVKVIVGIVQMEDNSSLKTTGE